MDEIFWAREASRGKETRNMKEEEDTGEDVLRVGDGVRGGVIERGGVVEGDGQSFRIEVVNCDEAFPGVDRARNAATAARFCAIFGIVTGSFVLGDVGSLSRLGVRATGFGASGGDGSQEFKNTERGKSLDSFRL